MRFICPHCGQNYEVKDSREGEIVNCQKCGGEIVLPEIRYGYKIIKSDDKAKQETRNGE